MLPVTGPCYCRFLVWQLVHDKLGLRGKTSLVLNRQNRRRCVDLESRIYSPLAGSDGVYTTVPLQVNLARVSGPSARYGFSRGFSCVLVCFFPLVFIIFSFIRCTRCFFFEVLSSLGSRPTHPSRYTIVLFWVRLGPALEVLLRTRRNRMQSLC